MTTPGMTVGLIGGGVMARAMGQRLLACGVAVVAYNRTPEKLHGLAASGAKIALSLAELVPQADMLIVCLTDATAICDLLLSKAGRQVLADSGLPLLNVSTIGIEASLHLERKFELLGVHYIDMPVSGGEEGALRGSLAGYVGRMPPQALEIEKIVGFLTGATVLLGDNQLAQNMKVLNNLCEAVNLWGAAEAITVAQRLNVDPATMVRALSIGRGNSTYLQVLLDRVVFPSAETSVSHDIRLKDLRLAITLAQSLNYTLPVTELVAGLFQESAQRFGAEVDQCVCQQYVERECLTP